MVAGLVLNAICPLVCFSNIVMMTEIASQRVEELAVQQTRSGRKTGKWSRLVCSMHFNNYFVEHVRGDMNWGGEGSSRIKKEFTCYFHGLQAGGGGGGLQKFGSFQHIFPFPHPHLYK